MRRLRLLVAGALLAGGIGAARADAPEPTYQEALNHAGPSARAVRSPDGAVAVGQVVTFDATASGAVRDHRWDFGDGAQAEGAVVTHAFPADGVYLVRLTVHDEYGAPAGAKLEVPVGLVHEEFVTEDVWIPTADYQLHGVAIRPAAPGRYPVVVEYGPYAAVPFSDNSEMLLVRSGYVKLHVEGPGRFASGGHWDQFGPEVRRAGHDAVEWAAAQPWSNGKVGLMGYSGPAVAALLTAGSRPPHLAAVVARNSYSDFYRDLIYPGGVYNSNTFGQFWSAVFLGGQDTGYAQNKPALLAQRWADYSRVMAEMAEHPWYDSYWRDRHITASPVSAPVLYVGSAHDLWPRSTYEIAKWIAPAGGKAVFVPGGHSTPDPSGWEAGGFSDGEARAWWERHLKGVTNGVKGRPPLSVYAARGGDMAPDRGAWLRFGGAAPHQQVSYQPLFLDPAPSPGGVPAFRSLSAAAGAGAASPAPTPLVVSPGSGLTTDNTPSYDKRLYGMQAPDDAQAVVFETPVLSSDMTVAGPVVVRLWATLAAADMAWSVHVNDVWPDGTSHYISSGLLAASQASTLDLGRSSFSGSELVRPWYRHDALGAVAPGELREYVIEVWPVANTFAAGHRLRLTIAGQNAVWRVAPASGPAALIYHDAAHPSRVLLPIADPTARALAHPHR